MSSPADIAGEPDGDALRWGVVGAGSFATFAAPILDGLPISSGIDHRPGAYNEVRSVASAGGESARRLAETLPHAKACSIEQLLRDPAIDAVYIASPPSSHYPIAIEALRAGKHVVSEKPLAMSAEDAGRLVAAATTNDRVLTVMHVLPLSPLHRRVDAILRAGVIGEPLFVDITVLGSDEGLHRDHWFWDEQLSGGIFIEHAVHFFALLGSWFDESEIEIGSAWQCARLRTPDDPPNVVEHSIVEHVGAALRIGPATLAHVYIGFHQPAALDDTRIRVVGERGEIVVRGWTPIRLELDVLIGEHDEERVRSLLPGASIATRPLNSSGARGRGQQYDVAARLSASLDGEPEVKAYADAVAAVFASASRAARFGTPPAISADLARRAVALADRAAQIARRAPVLGPVI